MGINAERVKQFHDVQQDQFGPWYQKPTCSFAEGRFGNLSTYTLQEDGAILDTGIEQARFMFSSIQDPEGYFDGPLEKQIVLVKRANPLDGNAATGAQNVLLFVDDEFLIGRIDPLTRDTIVERSVNMYHFEDHEDEFKKLAEWFKHVQANKGRLTTMSSLPRVFDYSRFRQ